MKIQIVHSETGEVVVSPRMNRDLETCLLAHFEQPIPWWRWVRKRRWNHFHAEITRVAAELRELTRFV